MKKIFLATVGLLFLTQCAPVIEYIPGEVNYYLTDFSKHIKDGFFITTEAPTGQYEPVGLLRVEISPQAYLRSVPTGVNKEDFPEFTKIWIKDNATNVQAALDSLVSVAKSLGANALTKYESSVYTSKPLNQLNSPSIPVFTVTGFAVKINE